MAFTELNSVEHYIMHQISGVNLNAGKVVDPKAGYGLEWQYQSSEDLPRGINEVLVEVVINQFRIHHRETKIPNIVLLINGFPVVVGEAKTPIRPSVSWLDGAHETHHVYENAVPQLFVPNT